MRLKTKQLGKSNARPRSRPLSSRSCLCVTVKVTPGTDLHGRSRAQTGSEDPRWTSGCSPGHWLMGPTASPPVTQDAGGRSKVWERAAGRGRTQKDPGGPERVREGPGGPGRVREDPGGPGRTREDPGGRGRAREAYLQRVAGLALEGQHVVGQVPVARPDAMAGQGRLLACRQPHRCGKAKGHLGAAPHRRASCREETAFLLSVPQGARTLTLLVTTPKRPQGTSRRRAALS